MVAFVRKNLITINAHFIPPGWPGWNGVAPWWTYSTVPPENCPVPTPPPQPTTVICVMQFCNPAKAKVTVTIPMTLQSNGWQWQCLWDSSAAGPGMVTWVIYGSGTVQAAQQGQFMILANAVNNF